VNFAGKEANTFFARFRSGPGWRTLASGVILSVIPLVFLVTLSQLTKARGPQWMPYTFENPYNYLFTSLELVKGQSPSFIMHPGTTTQVFGAVILRASSLGSTDELIEYTLRNPEKQIKKLHTSLLIFTTLILWLAPWTTAVFLRNNIVGILIQAPSLFLRGFFMQGIGFGSELMLVGFSIAAVCCCALLLAPSRSPNEPYLLFGIDHGMAAPASTRLLRLGLLAVSTGLICALGIVTKMTFFPLVLISLVCCRTPRNLVSFAVGFILGLAFALIPIYQQLPRLLTWIFSLGIHSGRYGTGPAGLPETGVYLNTLSDFIQYEPVLALVPSVTTIVAILLSLLPSKHKTQRTISWRSVLPVFGLQAFSYLVIAKHPGMHYLIPLSLTMGLSLVLLLYASQAQGSPVGHAIGLVTLIGLVSLGCKDFIEQTPDTYADLRDETADQLRLYKHAKEITKNDVRVDYFFSDSPEFPIWNGDALADNAFGQELARLYPNLLVFNVFNGQFQTFTESIKPEIELEKHDHLYFLGTPKWFPKVAGFDPATFETIDQAGDYCLQKWTRK
jgi:hypothetical protein